MTEVQNLEGVRHEILREVPNPACPIGQHVHFRAGSGTPVGLGGKGPTPPPAPTSRVAALVPVPRLVLAPRLRDNSSRDTWDTHNRPAAPSASRTQRPTPGSPPPCTSATARTGGSAAARPHSHGRMLQSVQPCAATSPAGRPCRHRLQAQRSLCHRFAPQSLQTSPSVPL